MAFQERAEDYAAEAKSDSTRRAYASDWSDFRAWCKAKGATSLHAASATVLAYLINSAEVVKVSTLQRRLVAIREAHKYAGHELDTSGVAFRDTWRGLRRVKGQPPSKKLPC
jgi:site-specific recombinase XerD